jgi:hypothetical protein
VTFDYAKTAATVQRLLTKFGASTTLTRHGEPIYDAETGTTTPGDTVSTVTVAVFPVEARYLADSQVQATDLQAYLSAVGVAEPVPGDVLAWGTKGLTVVKAKNLGPAGVFVLYELIVRA